MKLFVWPALACERMCHRTADACGATPPTARHPQSCQQPFSVAGRRGWSSCRSRRAGNTREIPGHAASRGNRRHGEHQPRRRSSPCTVDDAAAGSPICRDLAARCLVAAPTRHPAQMAQEEPRTSPAGHAGRAVSRMPASCALAAAPSANKLHRERQTFAHIRWVLAHPPPPPAVARCPERWRR